MECLEVPPSRSIELLTNTEDLMPQNAQNKRQLVFGPPKNYCGPRPPMSCELYVTNLPSSLDVAAFLHWLNQLGTVFEMRLMMSTANETRGYCFVRFYQEQAAIAAFELLSFLFLNGKRPNAQISQCKRQLFVSGIPKSLSPNDVRDGFNKVFHTVTKCVVYPQTEIVSAAKNRGFAFLDFNEHDTALDAKKFLRYHRLWGSFIKVDWARPNETHENAVVKLNANCVLRKNDYSAKLRLYALANGWCIPIVVYGNNFKQHEVQYGGILLKNFTTQSYSCIIIEVVGIVFDIHVLLCEVATHLVEVFCGLPDKHFIVRTRYGSTAKILYSFADISEVVESNSPSSSLFNMASAFELITSLEILAQYTSQKILNCYKFSFRLVNDKNERIAKFALIEGHKLSHFYCIYPKFRDNYLLNNNFNDTEIVLLQANATSNNNICISLEAFNALLKARTPDEGAFMLKSQRFNRHPNYILNFIDFELLKTCAFYHPMQQLNTPPLWVRGKTYDTSIFELS